MAIGPFWSVILPSEGTALNTNPSYEAGTTGAAAIQGATLGSAANEQQFGAWSLSVAPTSNGTSGAYLGTFAASNGSTYTYSAYVQGVSNVSYMLAVADTSNALLGSVLFTGGGTWQRYAGTYTEASGANRRVIVRKNGDATTGTFYVDGWNVCPGANLQTYLDGDQEGCIWLGAPHASQSSRSGQSRAGGSVVALAALGFTVDESLGIGMPPVENSTQSFAIVAGGEFQRQRAGMRPITLTSYLTGTSWTNLHQLRTAAINAFKIDAVTPQQPTRFLYTGGLGTVQIDAVYDGGMEFGAPDGFTENMSVRFLAVNPYWEATTDEGTALAPRVNLGSVAWILKRNSLGQWGTLGANGTTADGVISQLAVGTDGIIYCAGAFGSMGGTYAPYLGQYNPTTNRFGTLTGGTVNSNVYSLAVNSRGSLFFGGKMTNVAGTTSFGLGFWASTFGTLGGTITQLGAGGVFALKFNQLGTLFIGGDFTGASGTTAPYLCLYANGKIGTLTGQTAGTVNNIVYSLTVGLDNTLYFGGTFTKVAGTTGINRVGLWNGAFGSMGTGLDNTAYALATMPNGQIAVAGQFTTAGQGSAAGIALWNGIQYSALGSGLMPTGAPTVYQMLPTADGQIQAVGAFTSSGNAITFPDAMGLWNGYTWLPFDVDIEASSGIQAIAQGLDQTVYVAGNMSGTAMAASVTQIVNTGVAEAYPTLRTRNTGSGTARIYELLNTTTGDSLYFNLVLQPNEEAILDLTPGERSFTSSFQGPIFGRILPGSNIATWRLLSGVNTVSFFADSDSLTTALYWRPTHWSADSGTVY